MQQARCALKCTPAVHVSTGMYRRRQCALLCTSSACQAIHVRAGPRLNYLCVIIVHKQRNATCCQLPDRPRCTSLGAKRTSGAASARDTAKAALGVLTRYDSGRPALTINVGGWSRSAPRCCSFLGVSRKVVETGRVRRKAGTSSLRDVPCMSVRKDT